MFDYFEPSDAVTKIADSVEFYILIYLNLNEVHNVLLILENVFSCQFFLEKYSRNQSFEFNYKLGCHWQKLHFHPSSDSHTLVCTNY